MKSYVKPALFVLLNVVFDVVIGYLVHPVFGVACAILEVSVLMHMGTKAINKLKSENVELIDYVNELLEEQVQQSEESPAVRGARIAVTENGTVEFANAWRAAMPPDTARDFVVKFDGWDKSDWTMWVRLPWGKYQEHKAEIDYIMGRSVMAENSRSDLNGHHV